MTPVSPKLDFGQVDKRIRPMIRICRGNISHPSPQTHLLALFLEFSIQNPEFRIE
jgi:hypothetical protein